ncbi:hypothetical protein [Hansschlegelia zhihuaiae]|uniref:Alpha/beta hydrolase n=1 Tax=Hansschlegelia zhihuaiae TaxID=405005 RepID=A0A4Q0M2P2_9HYPH|nr:hypothetical protein [Hansschlegelia zhihuaiae]RXF67104.1 hypothetical protein EK403_21650 [Hansschlegelia zhihuaiae]
MRRRVRWTQFSTNERVEVRNPLSSSSPAPSVQEAEDSCSAVERTFSVSAECPIQIIWGDYIPEKLNPINVGPRLTLDSRRRNVLVAKLFAKAINRHGGDAEILNLREIGIRGNTHWPMLDNNYKIADLLSDWLEKKKLDRH